MKIKVLGTGASGSCYLLQSGDSSLLIELGFSYRNISKRLGYTPPKKAIVSHSHGTASKGIEDFIKNGGEIVGNGEVGNFLIERFLVSHSVECSGFLIADEDDLLFFATDCNNLPYPSGITKIMVECNYSMTEINPEISDLHAMRMNTHLSLEDLLDWLGGMDLSEVTEIILINPSEKNLDRMKAVSRVQSFTKIKTSIALRKGGVETMEKTMDAELKGKMANFRVITSKKGVKSVGQLFLENTYKEKVNVKVLKVVGVEKVAEFSAFFEANKNAIIAVSYYVSNQKEYDNEWYPSSVIVNEYKVVEAPKDLPVVEKQADPFPNDDSGLPF